METLSGSKPRSFLWPHFATDPFFAAPRALRIAPSLHLSEVITGVFPFEQAVEAFEEKARGGHAKVMLAFPGAEEGR